ncbi:pyridoxamine 5'-phosphate oxidase family protein [Nocardioides sp.]|uniref:pyridoxamine 5'-phosphate oxidase family protein n=1 Tax=Nocardioides sp. TaxID=35761 RepID=UPI003519D590
MTSNDRTPEQQKLADLLDGMSIGMLTTYGPEGPRSIPMARQDIEPGDTLWFITGRDTRHAAAVDAEARATLTFSARDSWVALTGRAEIIDDTARLEELWTTLAEAWMPEGPEDPNAVLLRFDIEQAEYWDTPGSRVASLLSFVKAKVTGDTLDADHGSLRP